MWNGSVCKLQVASILLIFNFVVFAQNTLDYYLNHSFKNSPEISAIRSQISSNSLDSIINIASRRPLVYFTDTALYAPIINGYGFDSAITNGGNLSAVLGVFYHVLGGPTPTVQKRQISLTNRLLCDSLVIAFQDLKKTITNLYLTAWGDLVQWKNAGEILELYSDEDPLLKKLVQKGVYLQTDYLSFLISYKQQQTTYIKYFSKFKSDLSLLNSACGIIDTATVELTDPALRLCEIPDTLNSIFFTRFTKDSLRIVTEQLLLKQSYTPVINVGAEAGFNSSLEPLSYKHVGFGGGVAFTVPIYDGGQYKYKKQKIDIEEYNRQREKNFFRSQYLQQIAYLQEQLDISQKLIDESSYQLNLHQTLIDADRKLLSCGEIKITDFVNTINSFLDTENSAAQSMVNREQVINELNYWSR